MEHSPTESVISSVSSSSNSFSAKKPVDLFIVGLAPAVTEENIFKYFSKFGDVLSARVMKDRVTKKSRGFGFLRVANEEIAKHIISENKKGGHSILDEQVEVKMAYSKRDDYEEDSSSDEDYNNTHGKKIFVGGLPLDLSKEEFKEFFEKFGGVKDVIIMVDKETSKSRGFGFVVFKSKKTAETVTKSTYYFLKNKRVEVKRALPKSLLATNAIACHFAANYNSYMANYISWCLSYECGMWVPHGVVYNNF